MLSRWRKQAREGPIVTKGAAVDKEVLAELKALRRIKKAYERFKLEHDLKKSDRVHFGTKSEVFDFIAAQREAVPVRLLCASTA